MSFFKYIVPATILVVAFNNCAPFSSNSDHSSLSSLDEEIPSPFEGSESETFLLGKAQYSLYCASCHGSLELSSKRGRTATDILNAFEKIPQMAALANQNIDVDAIAESLNTDTGLTVTPNSPKFICQAPNSRHLKNKGLVRLTQFEIKQTIRDIFGEQIFSAIEPTLEIYPQEIFINDQSEFDPSIDQSLFESWFNIAFTFSSKISQDKVLRKDFVPACLLNGADNLDFTDTQCLSQFVDSIGLKIFRRPLTTDQKKLHYGILTSNETFHQYNQNRLEAMLTSMLVSPEFINHFMEYKQEINGLGQLDSYSLANRLSYRLTGSLPDSVLFSAAKNNQLTTKDQRQIQALRLVQQPRSRRFVRNLFRHILHTDKASDPSAPYGSVIGVNSSGLKTALISEALDFVEHTVFEQQANFQELIGSAKVFPPTSESAKIFGSTVSNGVRDAQLSTKGHRGIFMRPILMLSPEPRTSPINRGIFITRRALCAEIPPPDPSALDEAQKIADTLELHVITARQEAEAVTGAASCQVCHKYINAQGFFLEQFGAYGDFRSNEKIFVDGQPNGTELSIDTRVDNLILDGIETTITNSADFVAKLGKSTQGQSCFAQNIYRFTEMTHEEELNHCQLSEMEATVRSGQPVLKTLIENAISEDHLWEKIN